MRILFVAAEAAPVAKVGGMGDVVGTLPRILKVMGHDVRILMPYYGFLPEKIENIPKQPIWRGNVMSQDFEVYETVLPNSDVPLYLFGNLCFLPRKIYVGEGDDWRFTFFANGATEFALNYWRPQIVHCHDWHTGMIPVRLHSIPDISTVFTIHNLAYQGPPRNRLEEITSCPDDMEGDNTMAAALLYADRVNAVSPTYAQQIQTPEYGENLQGLLSYISGKLVGIVNGIDVESYNPATDKHLFQRFDIETLEKRDANKAFLQESVGLRVDKETFLLGIVSRLVEQKGIDLILQVMDGFLNHNDVQFAILGTGERGYETQLWELASRLRGKMALQLLYSDAVSRRFYAGCDAYLMPSRFEPCGISQMLAMRYGCVPVVRHTGGLVDTVSQYDPRKGTGTGYSFERYEPVDFYTTLVRSAEAFKFKPQWRELQKRGMMQDFSWKKSAKQYEQLYQDILDTRDKAVAA